MFCIDYLKKGVMMLELVFCVQSSISTMMIDFPAERQIYVRAAS